MLIHVSRSSVRARFRTSAALKGRSAALVTSHARRATATDNESRRYAQFRDFAVEDQMCAFSYNAIRSAEEVTDESWRVIRVICPRVPKSGGDDDTQADVEHDRRRDHAVGVLVSQFERRATSSVRASLASARRSIANH
jgi:hypothetical protein